VVGGIRDYGEGAGEGGEGGEGDKHATDYGASLMKRTSLACKFHYTNPKRYYYLYPFASHAIHLRGLAKVSLNAVLLSMTPKGARRTLIWS
jgi:hypothetical protein